jgi:serine/threonine protein kinase/tetratricopeptide (TPR) repeat protein
MIGRTFAHYRIIERLGAGGMGEVYRAHDTHLDRDVAIKVLKPGTLDDSARRRFRREAEALSRLNHAHIATVHDFDSADGADFLVMEYVAGATLSQRIASGPLSEREIATLAGDVAAALEEAHERGIVHRDLKPANIVVTPKGRAKVLDFGIAQLSGTMADVEQTTTQTTSEFAGTLPYMAPEQVRGETIDARTDIYALGVVLFEMATGKRPFDETHTGRLTDAILHAPITPPTQLQSRLNPELERITLKCLERDPENRYQSAKEVAIDLRRLGSPTTVHHPAPAVPLRASRTALMLGAAAAIVAVGAVASIWLGMWRRSDGTAPASPHRIMSIVALPSKVVAQASDQFLTDAIPNTISAHLTQVSGLETKMPPSSVEVERVRGDLGKLADAYGVSAFVVSSLTAQADRLVLNVQLVDARSRRLLWSRDFEGRRDGYLTLARSAAEELRAAMRPQAAPVTSQARTSSSEAELAYQRGLHHFDHYNNQHEKSDFDQSLAAFQQALTLDPKLADAAACVAWLYEFQIEAGAPLDQMLPEVRRWGQRAIDIDERNSRAWAVMAVTELIGTPSRPRDALVYALRGAARGPRDAFAVNGMAIALWSLSASLTLASADEASRLDPLYLYPPLNAAESLIYLNRPEESLAYADGVLRLEPQMPAALMRKALALFELKRAPELAEVVPILQRQASEGRADPEYVSLVRDSATLLTDDPAAKRAALDRLERQALNPGPWAEYPPVQAWLIRYGRPDSALKAIEERTRRGRVPYDFLRLSPDFKAFATNDRYLRALAMARAQFDDTVALLREAEGRSELPVFMHQPLNDLLRTLGIDGGQRASRD